MSGFTPDALRVGYVPGVTVSKWERIWGERHPGSPLELIGVPQAEQEAALREGRVDMCFVRLPIDREGMHAIPLYHELAVVVVPKDHPISLFEEVTLADLADERLQDAQDVDAMADTVALVAAVGGAAVMPHSLARLHHRRDLIYRTVTDAPDTRIALAWPIDRTTDTVEEFIGVVRGRSVRSTRSPSARAETAEPQRKTAKRSTTKPRFATKRSARNKPTRRRGR
ncbi:LysR substrate-binding domain-containing protein [Nocardia transvalensis]|uniref:LysR substrate-binding domain-containing protein n=1 Tax=Nocardia transvalensis TaxID=37333 RepID=UPI001894F059|nr:LysR substrate-binding domain-containing protein [Nocardia transvalensis]MBF6329393.1 LysR family transcriptional regulator [Nocardia transvalensis]